MRRAEAADSHPIINEWGGTWVVPSQVRVVWGVSEPDVGNLHTHRSPELSLFLACLTVQFWTPAEASMLCQSDCHHCDRIPHRTT
jgi:hypothetical protein